MRDNYINSTNINPNNNMLNFNDLVCNNPNILSVQTEDYGEVNRMFLIKT
jgi:hypothetical protein